MGGWRRRWPGPVGALAVVLRQVGELDVEGINLLLVLPLLKARPRFRSARPGRRHRAAAALDGGA